MKKIKKIIIGLILGLILVFTLAIAPQKVKADTTITDLTGYTWTAYSNITTPTTPITYNFNFTYYDSVNYANYLGLKLDNNQVSWRYQEGENIYLKDTFGSVDGVKKWYDQAYRVINIIGGEDSTNTELINWLSDNGNFSLTTTDLTGFKWDAKSTINFRSLYGGNNYRYDYNLNFYDSSNTNYIKMHFYSYTDYESIDYYLNESDSNRVYSSSSWDVQSAKSIIITGGEDATNGMLIQFMYLNGKITKTTSTMTAGDYRFNDVLSLGQSEFTGNISINFTSNNQNYTGMRITADTLYYIVDSNNEIEVYNIGVNWLVTDSAYKRITVNSPQEVSTDFYNWFSSNTTKELYYTITFNRNGATSGDLPPLQDVLSGTTFDLNNYNPGNLGKTDSTFLGWNTDASATTPLSSIVINSDVLLYAIFSENPKSVNIKITCRDNVVWQGNAIFNNNKIVGGVSWDDPTMTNVFFESLDSQDVTLINEKYGLNPNYTSNQLLLFFRPFSTEKDENGKYLAYINLIRLTTPKGTYAVSYTSDTSPKNINFDSWLANENLINMLKVDSDNYYFNLEVSWSLEEPLPPGVAEWGNVATIMARIMASVTTLLNINIGFITLGNLLLIVISLSVLFFVIKVWKGGN